MIIKLKLLALLISIIFVSCGPQILNRPLINDSKQVFTVLNQIKYSKKDEYKEAVLFLVSEASSYMTGSEFIIDGGWTAW